MRNSLVAFGLLGLFMFVAVQGFNTKRSLEEDDWMEIIRGVSNDTGRTEQEVMTGIQEMITHKAVFSTEKRSFSGQCFLCNSLAKVLVGLIDIVPSDRIILGMVKGLCAGLNLFPRSVCDSTIDDQGQIVLYVARKTEIVPKLEELCSTFLKADCDGSKGEDWLVELPDVPKPPVEPIHPPEIGKPTIKILQLSDFHLDPIYQTGATAECDEPICCRGGAVGTPGNGTKGNAGLWGSYNCDTSVALVWDMLKHISRNHEDIDYAFLIGDASAHDFWRQNRDLSMQNQALVNGLVRDGLPGLQVYPIIGNHDSHPVNNFHPKDEELIGHELFDISWLLEATWNDWTNTWLPAELKNDNDMYYSVQIFPGLRLIALNSNYFYIMNWWNMYYNEDPSGQLAWFVKELQDAEDKGEKVQLLIHQPPGADAYKTYSHNFWRIVQRYESTIRGIFAGHTHTDEFQILFDDEDPERATAVAYVGPSVTTFSNLNPAYRIYTVDGNYEGSTYAILDFEDYYVDITEANINGRPRYRKLYSPKEAYNMDDLNPQSWKEVVDNFISDENVFNKYYKFWHRDSPTQPACDADCRRDQICYIVSADSSNYEHCKKVPQF